MSKAKSLDAAKHRGGHHQGKHITFGQYSLGRKYCKRCNKWVDKKDHPELLCKDCGKPYRRMVRNRRLRDKLEKLGVIKVARY